MLSAQGIPDNELIRIKSFASDACVSLACLVETMELSDIWEPRRLKVAKIEGMLKQVVGKGTVFLQIVFKVCCSFSTNWAVNF